MDDLAFMWNGEPVQHKLALLRSDTTTDVLRLDREHSRRPDDDVIHVAVSLVDVIEDRVPERLGSLRALRTCDSPLMPVSHDVT